MRTRVPLFAQLLVWFFANLLVLMAGLLLIIRIQFGPLDNWLLPASSQNEIQAMGADLVGNLSHSARADWANELAELSTAYKMDFALYDARGERMAGPDLQLPDRIHRALVFGHRPPQGPPDGMPGDQPPLLREGPQPMGDQTSDPPPRRDDPAAPPPQGEDEEHHRPMAEFPKSVLRTDQPLNYWLLVRLPPEPLQTEGPVTLLGPDTGVGDQPAFVQSATVDSGGGGHRGLFGSILDSAGA